MGRAAGTGQAGAAKKPWGCATRGLVGVALVGGIAMAGGLGARAWDAAYVAPWAWPPGPVLTDSWVGTAEVDGTTVVLHLDLVRAHNGQGFISGGGRAGIDGTGAWCTTGATVTAPVELEPVGNADRSADEVLLSPGVVEPPAAGIVPSQLLGSFGGDDLELVAQLTRLADGAGTTAGEVEVVLTRADRAAFDAACTS